MLEKLFTFPASLSVYLSIFGPLAINGNNISFFGLVCLQHHSGHTNIFIYS